MSEARLHPLTLRFDAPDVEAAFRVDHARRSVVLARLALVVGLVQFALFGFLDKLMVPMAWREIQEIRAIACVGVLLVIAYTFTPPFRRTMHAALAVAPLLVGGAIVTFVVVGQEANDYYDYYAGLILLLTYVHVLLRLPAMVASAISGALIAAFMTAATAVGTSSVQLINDGFFLFSANATGMIASYALERYERREFWQARSQAATNSELNEALERLCAAQDRLIQQEKLASLGRFTSGVAHELKNPLNFVNNFARLSVELADELEASLDPAAQKAETNELLDVLRLTATKIAEHSERADGIVRSMLAHAGSGVGEPRPTDLNALVEEGVAAAVEGFRARYGLFEVVLERSYGGGLPLVEVVPQEVGRVVTNLVGNALWAVRERALKSVVGGDGAPFVPAVHVRTGHAGNAVAIEVEDNGEGISRSAQERVFEPFFTTKAAGEGAGLGLSLAHDIVVQGHGGTLGVESAPGHGACFTVTLPVEPAHAELSGGKSTGSDESQRPAYA